MKRAGQRFEKTSSIYHLHYLVHNCLRVVEQRTRNMFVTQGDLDLVASCILMLEDFLEEETRPWLDNEGE